MSALVSVPTEEMEQSKVYVLFIDVLFAVVLGQSFVLLSSQSGISLWISAPFENFVTLLDVILAYALVVTSWVGFHTSTRKLPIRNISRFAMDVVLLFLYYLIFVNVGSFPMVAAILTLVFGLYFAWEVARLFEYPDKLKELDLERRTWITLVFLIVFIFVTIAAALNKDSRMEVLLWAASFVSLFVFRYIFRGGPKKKTPKVIAPPPAIYKDDDGNIVFEKSDENS